MKYKIYTLSHPITDIIRYIGKTIDTLPNRRSKHINDSKKANNRRCNWIKKLTKQGLKPKIELLDECENNIKLCEMEIYWISQFRTWGFDLLNATEGGEGSIGYKHKPEDISKMSIIQSNRWKDKKKPPVKRMTKDEQNKLLSDVLSIPIIQYDLQGNKIKEWKSINQVIDEWKCSSWSISSALKDKSRVGMGFFWRYKNIEDRDKIEISFKEVKRIRFIFTNIETNEISIFNGVKEASEKTNISIGCIYEAMYSNRLLKKKFKIEKEIFYGPLPRYLHK